MRKTNGYPACPGERNLHAVTGTLDWNLDVDRRVLINWVRVRWQPAWKRTKSNGRVPDPGEREACMGLHGWHLPIVDTRLPDAGFAHTGNRAGVDLRRRLATGEVTSAKVFRDTLNEC